MLIRLLSNDSLMAASSRNTAVLSNARAASGSNGGGRIGHGGQAGEQKGHQLCQQF